MKTQKTIIITGTHHTPAIELIRLLRQDKQINWRVHYLAHLTSSDTHLVNTIIPRFQVPVYNIDSGKFNRRDWLETVFNLPKIIFSFFKSLSLVHRISPDIVVSFGGYVSVPVIMAAYFEHIPSLTHEQTLTISLATKINSLFADKVALSFPSNFYPKKSVITGNLLRQEIFTPKSKKFISLKKPLIYITGGNQGSLFLNQLMETLIPTLLKKYSIIHQIGKNYSPQFKHPQYYVSDYIGSDDIGTVLHQAEIIISRAGANTCQELAALGKKSILIPLPFSQQNEQLLNARWLHRQYPDTTVILPQNKINSQIIYKFIRKLHSLPSPSPTSVPNSSTAFLQLIYDLIF